MGNADLGERARRRFFVKLPGWRQLEQRFEFPPLTTRLKFQPLKIEGKKNFPKQPSFLSSDGRLTRSFQKIAESAGFSAGSRVRESSSVLPDLESFLVTDVFGEVRSAEEAVVKVQLEGATTGWSAAGLDCRSTVCRLHFPSYNDISHAAVAHHGGGCGPVAALHICPVLFSADWNMP